VERANSTSCGDGGLFLEQVPLGTLVESGQCASDPKSCLGGPGIAGFFLTRWLSLSAAEAATSYPLAISPSYGRYSQHEIFIRFYSTNITLGIQYQ